MAKTQIKTQMKTQIDILMTCTAAELADTAMRLGLEAHRTERKADIAARIADRVLEDPLCVASCLGLEVIDAVQDCRKATGQARTKTLTFPIWMTNDDEMLAFSLEELRYFGLAWRGRSGWTVGEAANACLRPTRSQRVYLEAQEDLYDTLLELIPVYGVLSVPDAVRLIDSLEPGETEQADDRENKDDKEEIVLGVWMRREGMYGLMTAPFGEDSDEDSGEQSAKHVMLIDPELTSPMAMLTLQRFLRSNGQDFRPWRQDELRVLADTHVVITRDAAIQLDPLVRELDADPQDVALAFEEAVWHLHEGDRGEALAALEECIVPERVLTASQRWILSRILDKIPLPQLLGRTIDEANRFTVAEGLRIKPGDPCPCGSGRRYSKCHGRLH